MTEISTVEEFWFKNTGQNINQEEYSAMIEFAKLHVEAALKEASEKANYNTYGHEHIEEVWIDKDSILNSYPLTNIK
jgi:hypothetical protein